MGRLANKIALMNVDVHALIICDCGHREFRVGVRLEGLDNRICMLQCTECSKQMPVPFQKGDSPNDR